MFASYLTPQEFFYGSLGLLPYNLLDPADLCPFCEQKAAYHQADTFSIPALFKL